MRVGLIVGSHQENSGSLKTAHFFAKHFEESEIVETRFLPLWDNGQWSQGDKWNATWTDAKNKLKTCDAFVIISPEYGGMVPAALKNFFLMAGNLMAHKAGLIVSVSSGINGAYPVAELRSSSYKNTKICYIPDHVIVRNVEHVFGDELSEHEASLRERITHSCKMLELYSNALTTVRESMEKDPFPYGM